MDTTVERLATLCRDLSIVYPSERTAAAAADFLALDDPGASLGRALRYLVWQRTLPVVFGHLVGAGADLDAIRVPAHRVDGVFGGARRVWTVPGREPLSARQLAEVLADHKRLLAGPVDTLLEAGMTGFVLVSGRSYQAAYPSYSARVEFDTDLLTTDLPAAASVSSTLDAAGYSVDTVCVVRTGERPHAVFENRRQIGHHEVSIGTLAGGYHGHRGPIEARARVVSWRTGQVAVPAPEDMLTMLGARVARKRQVALVNFNDAAVILTAEPTIDWDLVTGSARAGGLETPLAVVLEGAEQVVGRPVVPREVWRDLDRTWTARLTHRLARAGSDPAMRLEAMERGRPTIVTRLRRSSWTGPVALRQAQEGVAPGPFTATRRRLEMQVYARQLRKVRSANVSTSRIDLALRRLRPRYGALCEVVPDLAAAEHCLAGLGGRYPGGTTADDLRRLGDALPRPVDHDCDRFRFELTGPTGR